MNEKRENRIMERRKTILFQLFVFTTVYAVVSGTVLELSDRMLAAREITLPLLSQILAQFCAGGVLICFLKKFPFPTENRKRDQSRIQPGQWIRWILICVCASVALNELLALPCLQELLPGRQAAEQLYAGSFILVFVNAVVSSPILEEIFYRGVLYRGIRCLTGPWTAAVVSAGLFGLFHMNVVQGVFAGLIGLLFAAALEQCKSLIFPILAHMSVNLTGVLTTQVGWADSYGHGPLAAFAGIVCGAICLLLLAERKGFIKGKGI